MVTKIYLCPTDKRTACSWEGASEDILQHFIEEHEDLLSYTNSVTINTSVESENRLIFLEEEIYLLQAKILEDHLCIFLRYLGPVKIASKLTFDVDIFQNDVKLHKSKIIVKNGCFCVSLETLRTVFDDFSLLGCSVNVTGDFTNDTTEDADQQTSQQPDFKKSISFVGFEDETLNLGDLFHSPSAEEHLFKDQEHFTDNLGGTLKYSKEHNSLQRSKTFGGEDKKPRNSARRHPSTYSLGFEENGNPEVNCSNCGEHLAEPIYLCPDMHNICSNCCKSKAECTICGQIILLDRNWELEQQTANYQYQCKYNRNGCQKKSYYNEILDHEIQCSFCTYVCPIEECGFCAPYKPMVSHLSLIHSSVKLFESFIAVFKNNSEAFLVNDTMGIFYCTVKTMDDRVTWKAKFCGPKERKFFCELKFKGKHITKPLLLVRIDDVYTKEMSMGQLKEFKLKPKNSILTITR